MRTPLVLCLVAFALSGCPKKGERSEAFADATKEFNELYGRYLEEAYLREEMAPIEAKLAGVPEASSDYARAQELLKRIRSGRERTQAEIDARAEAIAQAARPSPNFEFQPDESPRIEEAPKPPPPVDAGPPGSPAVGMALSDIQRNWGECFTSGPSLGFEGRGELQTLALKDFTLCRQNHPGFDQQLVVIDAGKVLLLANKKDIAEVPPPDAGPPAVPPPAAPIDAPDAG